MKRIVFFLACCLLATSLLSNPVNISTGVDPGWTVGLSSPATGPTYTVPGFSSFWQPTPVAGTGARWINPTAGSQVPGIYIFEKKLAVPAGTKSLKYDFQVAFDDELKALELVKPDGTIIPLTAVYTSSYHLTQAVTDSINCPQAGDWTIRAKVHYIDKSGGFMLSGYITLKGCDCPPECICGEWRKTRATYNLDNILHTDEATDCGKKITTDCDKPVIINGNFTCTGPCEAIRSAMIYAPSGALIATTSSFPIVFTPLLSTGTAPYKVVLKGKCGNKECDSCIISVFTNCKENCTCGKWEKTTITYVLDNNQHTDEKVSCNKNMITDCDRPVYINGSFYCNGNCDPIQSATVYKPDGSLLMTNVPLPVTFTPFLQGSNPYKVVLKGKCGKDICDSCIISVTPRCIEGCTCGDWNDLTVNDEKQYKCGTEIPWSCNKPFSFLQSYACIPDRCRAEIKWEITRNAVSVASGNGIRFVNGSFTPSQNGTYVLTFSASCDGKPCRECRYLIVVKDCCETKTVQLFRKETPVPADLSCIEPGIYTFTLQPGAPPVAGSYTLMSLPNGSILGSGFFNSSTPLTLTIPPYSCGITGFRLTYQWDKICSATIEKNICQPPCCGYFIDEKIKKSLNGPDMDFATYFTLSGTPIAFSKVKVQILEIKVAGSARPDANIVTISSLSPALAGNVSTAITTPGNAFWFGPFTATGNIAFKGRIINISPVASPYDVSLKLRYTFYRMNGACPEIICEKDITH